MTLPNKSDILKLNKISGGRPTTIAVAPRGGSQTDLNSISGGRPLFVIGELGLNFNGFVNVSGTWKQLTNGFINVNGTWKELNNLNVNVSGTWKT
tara:strand:+ start:2642 stop:2926 length:285 start_codon:yes stop_codon:yes gene_type:complete